MTIFMLRLIQIILVFMLIVASYSITSNSIRRHNSDYQVIVESNSYIILDGGRIVGSIPYRGNNPFDSLINNDNR